MLPPEVWAADAVDYRLRVTTDKGRPLDRPLTNSVVLVSLVVPCSRFIERRPVLFHPFSQAACQIRQASATSTSTIWR